MTESQGESQESQGRNRRQAGSGVATLRAELTPQIAANKAAIEKVGEGLEESKKVTVEGFQNVEKAITHLQEKIDPNKSAAENSPAYQRRAVELLKSLADADAKIHSDGYVKELQERQGDLGKFYDSRLNRWGQSIAAVGSGIATWLNASQILPYVNQGLNTLVSPLALRYGWSAISLSSPLWVIPIAFMAGSAGKFVYDKISDGFVNYREKRIKSAVTAEANISEVRAQMIKDLRVIAGGEVKLKGDQTQKISELDSIGEAELTEWLNKSEGVIKQMNGASVHDRGANVFRKASKIVGGIGAGLAGGANFGIPGVVGGGLAGITVADWISKPISKVIRKIFPTPVVNSYGNPGGLALTK